MSFFGIIDFHSMTLSGAQTGPADRIRRTENRQSRLSGLLHPVRQILLGYNTGTISTAKFALEAGARFALKTKFAPACSHGAKQLEGAGAATFFGQLMMLKQDVTFDLS